MVSVSCKRIDGWMIPEVLRRHNTDDDSHMGFVWRIVVYFDAALLLLWMEESFTSRPAEER